MSPAQQLTFDLPVKPALGRGDFFVSDANRIAVEMLETPETWPQGKMLLTGETGAGKTHLTHVWAGAVDAKTIHAADLGNADIPRLADGPVVVEDADRIAAYPGAQEALFHLHNLTLANGNYLLITARNAPGAWQLTLADLASRMQGTALVSLLPPDDQLLAAVMLKLFADRQIAIQPNVFPYLLRRMDRSFAAAHAIVGALDRASLSQGRAVTRAFAGPVLDKLGQGSA